MFRNKKPAPLLGSFIGAIFALVSLHAHPDHHGAPMKAAVDTVMKAWDTGNVDQLDEVLADNFTRTAPQSARPVDGPDGLKQAIRELRDEYRDFHIVNEENHFHDDIAFVRWTVTGTRSNEGEVTSAGKPVKVSGLTMFRFEEGRIVKEEIYFDTLGWLQQLGYSLQEPTAR